MKSLLTRLALALAGMLACWALFQAGNSGRIGALVGTLHPCVQDPKNSFPCNGMFDVYAMAAALVFGLACVVVCCLQVVAVRRAIWPANQTSQPVEIACPTRFETR